MTDLLDVIDELTKPKVEHVAQRTDGGEWIRTHTVDLPPLLQRMHDAVWPSSNTDTSSSSSKHERSPLDVSALFEYAKMCAAIGSWCRILDVKPTRDPIKDLRAWYAATLKVNDFDTAWYLREVRKWKHTIEAHLDPPKAFEAKAACPICDTTGWGDPYNGGSSWPIEIRYRITDTGRMADETATCRACRTVWHGHDSVMELADELGERHAEPETNDNGVILT